MINYIPELKQQYNTKIAQKLYRLFEYRTIMEVPRLEKVVVSCGLGEAIQNSKLLDSVIEELTLICGQRAVRTKAKKSIANFKLRKGVEIGAMVTLRGNRMYDFLSRLIHVALPRVKDFRGLKPKSFDGHGNYSFGINEQIIFPEIDYDKIQRINGFNIVIDTTSNSDLEARELLTMIGLPFQKWK